MSRAVKPENVHKLEETVGERPDVARTAELARRLYGSDAPSAVAFCALDAWFEGSEEEFRELAAVFRRLEH